MKPTVLYAGSLGRPLLLLLLLVWQDLLPSLLLLFELVLQLGCWLCLLVSLSSCSAHHNKADVRSAAHSTARLQARWHASKLTAVALRNAWRNT